MGIATYKYKYSQYLYLWVAISARNVPDFYFAGKPLNTQIIVRY